MTFETNNPYWVLYGIIFFIVSFIGIIFTSLRFLLDTPKKYQIKLEGEVFSIQFDEILKAEPEDQQEYWVIIFTSFTYENTNFFTTRYYFYPESKETDGFYISKTLKENEIQEFRKHLIGKKVIVHYDGKEPQNAFIELNGKSYLIITVIVLSIFAAFLSWIAAYIFSAIWFK